MKKFEKIMAVLFVDCLLFFTSVLHSQNISDLNQDGKTDLQDLDWFSSCWLRDGSDPNCKKCDFKNDGVVDFADFAIFSREWLKEDEPEPNELILGIYDRFNIQGDVNISVRGFPPETDVVSAYLDGEKLGLYFQYEHKYVIDFESYCYLNGWHNLKIDCLDVDENILLSQNTSLYFKNKLYGLNAGDFYEPNIPYQVSGVYNGNNSLKASVMNLNDEIIWQQTFSGRNLNFSFEPNQVFDEINSLVIEEVDYSSSNSIVEESISEQSAAKDEKEKWERIIAKKWKQEDYLADSPIDMIITLPDKKLAKFRKGVIKEEIFAGKRRSKKPGVLYYKDCNWQNLTWSLIVPQKINTWINHGHGNSEIKGVQRTFIYIYDDYVFSYLGKDTSDPNDDLPGKYEKKGKSMISVHLYSIGKMKITAFDSCKTIENFDMAVAVGVYSQSNYENLDQVFIGWEDDAYASSYIRFYENFLKDFWFRMGSAYSLWDSYDYAWRHMSGNTIAGENFMYICYDAHRIYLK